ADLVFVELFFVEHAAVDVFSLVPVALHLPLDVVADVFALGALLVLLGEVFDGLGLLVLGELGDGRGRSAPPAATPAPRAGLRLGDVARLGGLFGRLL